MKKVTDPGDGCILTAPQGRRAHPRRRLVLVTREHSAASRSDAGERESFAGGGARPDLLLTPASPNEPRSPGGDSHPQPAWAPNELRAKLAWLGLARQALLSAGLLVVGALVAHHAHPALPALVVAYTRFISVSDVLQHAARRSLLDEITKSPGVTLTRLSRALQLDRRVVLHHVEHLERWRLAFIVRASGRTRVYAAGARRARGDPPASSCDGGR